MMSQTELPPGSTIRFVFPELSDAFWLQAVVVRAQPSRTGSHYGCRFVETSPRETDELFRYVLRTQGAQRRQQMLA
jgi:c-di-GMP-binding flagellar brake protein YcgR